MASDTTTIRQRKKNSPETKKSKNEKVIDETLTSRVKEILDDKTTREKLRLSDRRWEGDGESVPETPPNETAPSPRLAVRSDAKDNPFAVNLSFDVMAVLLFVSGCISRLIFLEKPNNVVFDEMHYGKYVGLYMKNTFFFDSNPPLGKLLIALVAYIVGFDGQFEFDKIGVSYDSTVPVFALRFVPAFCGSLLTPTVYLVMCELGLGHWSGALAGFMVLFDTAILAQSRFILLESMMILSVFLALLCVLKFRHHQKTPFSAKWWLWITASATFMGIAFCVKYLAYYSCCLCCTLLLRDFWRRLAIKNLSNKQLFAEFFTQATLVLGIPTALYIGSFYVHLSLLTKAGAHDALMTSAFQASLEGGLSSIIEGQPSAIAHGSQITLRHTHGRVCWMHSHEAVYPVRYSDGRGSSHQQQVSCYGYKDVNNWWLVKRPDRDDLAVHEPIDVIKDGDVIQLVHGITHRALNSHDVAAPMSPHNQEVSCYIDYNISMPAENLWKVQIVNKDIYGDEWQTVGSQIRLVHVSTEQALKFSGRLYPDWGYHQNEIVCDKHISGMDTIWNVEEHRYTKNDEDKKSIERELFQNDMIPTKPTQLSFWQKFLELQLKMLVTNQENVKNHNYASEPMEWPFLTRGIAYFIARDSNAQVHLMGNPVIWMTGTLGVLGYCGLWLLYVLRRRRLCFDISEEMFEEFINVGEVLLGGFLFNFIPFFFYDRTLFLHHYLSAYIFKLLLTAYVCHHVHDLISRVLCSSWLRRLYVASLCLWSIAAVYAFSRFVPLCFGITPLTADQVNDLKWRDSWDLIVHKP